MKRSSAELKQMARTLLQGNYGTFVGTFVLYTVIISFSSILLMFVFTDNVWSTVITREIVTILFSIVTSIFAAGLLWQSLSVSRGNPISVNNLIHGFAHHPDRFIVVQLVYSLITITCQIPAIILSSYMFMDSSYGLEFSVVSTIFLTVPLIALYLLGDLLSYVILLRFSLANYLLLDNDSMSALTAMRTSAVLMKGNKGRYFYLYLSFFGLSLLGVLSCGIAYLWLQPYMLVTMTQFYREVTGELNQPQPENTSFEI